MEMCFEEAAKCGRVQGVAAPVPPPHIASDEPCRAYIKYKTTDEAQRLKEMMDGRLFDDNKVGGWIGWAGLLLHWASRRGGGMQVVLHADGVAPLLTAGRRAGAVADR